MAWNLKRKSSLAALFVLSSLAVTGCGVANTLNSSANDVTQSGINNQPMSNATTSSNETGARGNNTAVTTDTYGQIVPGSKAPNFTLTSINGKSTTLQQLLADGKPILINAWASWCPPCKMETPDLVKASKEYGNKIQFVGVNLTTMDSIKNAKAFVRHYRIPYRILLDTKGIFRDKYTVVAEPMTYLISPQGTVLKIHVGMMTTAQMDKLIQGVL